MAKYIKLFTGYQAYLTYINGNNKVLPNVSYCDDNNNVYYTSLPPQQILKINNKDVPCGNSRPSFWNNLTIQMANPIIADSAQVTVQSGYLDEDDHWINLENCTTHAVTSNDNINWSGSFSDILSQYEDNKIIITFNIGQQIKEYSTYVYWTGK